MYIRYADDFVIAASTEQQVQDYIALIKEHLNEHFFLQLNSPVIHNSHEGIEFLGIILSDKNISITDKKKQVLIERIHSIRFTKSSLSAQSIETLRGIKNYYARLLPEEILKDFDYELMNQLNTLIKRNQKAYHFNKRIGRKPTDYRFLQRELY